MGKKAKPRQAVVISDIHCGSTVGLMHPDCVLADETGEHEVKQRPYQQWLWLCWMDAQESIKRVVGDDPYLLVINGDCIEGVHHGGSQLVSKDTKHHVQIAHHCLNPLTEHAESTYIVRGTECHTRTDESTLGILLGAEKNATTGLYAHDHLSLVINGCKCSWRHHIGTTTRTYLEAGTLSIALANEQLECLRAGWPVPDVTFRAHRHRHGEYTDGIAMMLVSAAWQGETRHVHKIATGSISRPSWIIADWRGKEDGELPHIHRRVYCPPVGGSA